jgi:hypothetical protein
MRLSSPIVGKSAGIGAAGRSYLMNAAAARDSPEEIIVTALCLSAVIPLMFGLCGYLNVQ